MSKTIILCTDGTWCGPNNNDDGKPALTNVFKLFDALKRNTNDDPTWTETEREISFGPAHAEPLQVAKYLHGVGDSSVLAEKIAGGVLGVGVTARIARGYTYISRNYVAGDRIVIIGFSRGAYTARALAGLIVAQGLLKPELAQDDDRYDNAVEAWFMYRHASKTSWTAKAIDGLSYLDNVRACFDAKSLDASSFIAVDAISAVAVWDTVGSIGVPLDGLGVDVADYVDTILSDKVALGLHAVSLDEQRESFVPTLWQARTNVTQKLFPGGHTDVGGGNVTSGLSDGPFKWFMERLEQADVGLQFNLPALAPNAADIETKEWEMHPWNLMPRAPRQFLEANMLLVDTSVYERMASTLDTQRYQPLNLPTKAAN